MTLKKKHPVKRTGLGRAAAPAAGQSLGAITAPAPAGQRLSTYFCGSCRRETNIDFMRERESDGLMVCRSCV